MAKRKVGEESPALYRVQKFEVKPSHSELVMILDVSQNLREVFNSALEERRTAFETFIAPIYNRLRSVGSSDDVLEIKRDLRKAYEEHSITLFDQINLLTPRRASDPGFASVTRNFQEETLDMLDGAYKSFLALRKNGDYDARSPRKREPGFFQKIPGRSGFKVKDGSVVISLGSGRKVSFSIPAYQLEKLGQAVKLKKFEIFRDEHDLSKPGRFWISIAYELEKPEGREFSSETAVYLSLGASFLGIVSPRGEEVIKFWRSDKFWQPKIETVQNRMKTRTKGSRGWDSLNRAKRRMQVLSSRQHVQDEREIARYLVERHGCHFVVPSLVVRSKKGKLADGSKPERGGSLGLNWAAQNTGSLSRLVLHLREKVKEVGGSVREHKLDLSEAPPGLGDRNKLWLARKLQESFCSL